VPILFYVLIVAIRMRNDFLNATLTRRHDLTDGLCILHLRPDAGVSDFEPGQFVRLGLPDSARATPGGEPPALIRRAYSLASAPGESELEIFVVEVPEGRLTPEVWKLAVGARLWAEPRMQGDFTLRDVPADHDLIMVATGTGIAPYISMLRAYGGLGRWRRFVVVHGVRRAVDLGYERELEAASQRWPDVHYLPLVSREAAASAWRGRRGRVQHLFEPPGFEPLLGRPLDPAHAHVFLCGNPEMVQSMRALLEPHGFRVASRHRPGTLHVERYW
jgi:ferredoxin/flavodoxin---NADP+ reductase